MKRSLCLMMGLAAGGIEAANVKVDVDYLYWIASQPNMVYASTIDNVNVVTVQNPNVQRNDWTSGVRLGIGYGTPCCWDGYFSWTRLHNSVFGKTHNQFIVASQLSGGNGIFVGGNGADLGPATSRWDLNFDRFDLQFGSTLFEYSAFLLHPNIGISGITVNQSQHITYENFIDTNTGNPSNTKADLVNNFWGIGPSLGFDSAIRVGYGIKLVGECDFAAYYGRIPSTVNIIIKEERTTTPNHYVLNRNKLVPSFRLYFGLEWGTKVQCYYPIGVAIGFETQYFWGLWRNQNSEIQNLYITDVGYSNLELSGITARVSFGF